MAAKLRSEIFSPDEQAIVHCMNQCVRKLFLLGDDKATKKANRRRRRKFERELKKVSGGFAIDLLSYAIMENHFHLILRSRPDVLAQWSDAEVVKQWHKLCRVVTDGKGKLVNNPDDQQVAKMLANTKKVAKWRARLSDISWYMKLLSERTSRWFNAEDKVPGHFWKGRFKSVLLMDERALMTCSMYVDLNRIQAELAASLESSDYTSIQRRIQAAAVRTSMHKIMAETFAVDTSIVSTAVIDRNACDIPEASSAEAQPLPDAHLSPVQIDEQNDPLGPHLSPAPTRCSDKGFLPMSQARYEAILNWSADQIRHRHKGEAFDESPPELAQLQIEPDVWCKLVTQFDDLFFTAAGSPETIDTHPSKSGKRFNMPRKTREMLSA